MAKRHWPDHTAVGRTISVERGNGSEEMKIVDVKCGPMFINTDSLNQPSAEIHGSLKLRLKPANGGSEFWTPPTDGAALVKWCAEQDAKAAALIGATAQEKQA